MLQFLVNGFNPGRNFFEHIGRNLEECAARCKGELPSMFGASPKHASC